jgi:SMODS and SLOG-associating 2TM effector domain 1
MLRQLVFWLGAVAVLLGVVSAVKPLVVAWTAVVATVIASLSSRVQSQRYQTLVAAYQSTARRLETLRDKWEASAKTDVGKNAFIQSCEETMSLENSAWVTQWSQRKPSNQKPSNSD